MIVYAKGGIHIPRGQRRGGGSRNDHEEGGEGSRNDHMVTWTEMYFASAQKKIV